MFKAARLKLTGWYLLIIMTVSLAFSGFIYRTASVELQRFAEAQRMRFERRTFELDLPRDFGVNPQIIVDSELLAEAKRRILVSLAVINLGILGLAGVLGYYLSGKTLSPIQEMMDEQYRFVSDASHELKTPITAIKTTLEVAIRDKELTKEEANVTLVTSLEEVNRLQRLAEVLLELTHKKVIGKVEPQNMAEIVKLAIKTIKPLADRKGITIQSRTQKVMGAVDPTSFVRALVAILDNAVKYSRSKEKVMVGENIDGRVIKIIISDRGVGIQENDIPHIFDRFYRADLARSENGYGLGLPIAKQIIEEHHGTIDIESTIGKGISVIITLPYSAKLQDTII
ncbi:MAG: HAMP domain-containing sensor histidine kinase [bacterium]